MDAQTQVKAGPNRVLNRIRFATLLLGIGSHFFIAYWNAAPDTSWGLRIGVSLWNLSPFAAYVLITRRDQSIGFLSVLSALLLSVHSIFVFNVVTSKTWREAFPYVLAPLYEFWLFAILYSGRGSLTSLIQIIQLKRSLRSWKFWFLGLIFLTLVTGLILERWDDRLSGEATNKSASPAELGKISNTLIFKWDGDLRRRLAENHSTPPDVLEKLASDPNSDVLESVAGNSSTPPYVLRELAKSRNELVVEWVGSNPSSPKDLLASIASHKEKCSYLYGVAINPHTPLEILNTLSDFKHCPLLPVKLAVNPKSTPAILEKVAASGGLYTRTWLAKNPQTTCKILTDLLKQPRDTDTECIEERYRKQCQKT